MWNCDALTYSDCNALVLGKCQTCESKAHKRCNQWGKYAARWDSVWSSGCCDVILEPWIAKIAEHLLSYDNTMLICSRCVLDKVLHWRYCCIGINKEKHYLRVWLAAAKSIKCITNNQVYISSCAANTHISTHYYTSVTFLQTCGWHHSYTIQFVYIAHWWNVN